MHRKVSRALTVVALIGASMAGGCAVKMGHFVPNSHFAYPNSNITNLGPVSAEVKKSAFLIPPTLTLDDVRGAYRSALQKAQGANILINFKEDTTFTMYPYFYVISYQIEGTAAHMEVGKQTLK